MVIFIVSRGAQSSRVRRWYRDDVYRVYHFRLHYEEEKATRDPQKRKQLQQKMAHLQNKIEQHMTYGNTLGLKDAQMREFNLAIIDEIKKGKDPRAIIQTLIKENGQK